MCAVALLTEVMPLPVVAVVVFFFVEPVPGALEVVTALADVVAALFTVVVGELTVVLEAPAA